MKAKVIKKFRDIETKEIRKVGDIFDCSNERFEAIKQVGEFVESAEEEQKDNSNDSGIVCDIAQMSLEELKNLAKQNKIKNYSKMSKEDLIVSLTK